MVLVIFRRICPIVVPLVWVGVTFHDPWKLTHDSPTQSSGAIEVGTLRGRRRLQLGGKISQTKSTPGSCGEEFSGTFGLFFFMCFFFIRKGNAWIQFLLESFGFKMYIIVPPYYLGMMNPFLLMLQPIGWFNHCRIVFDFSCFSEEKIRQECSGVCLPRASPAKKRVPCVRIQKIALFVWQPWIFFKQKSTFEILGLTQKRSKGQHVLPPTKIKYNNPEKVLRPTKNHLKHRSSQGIWKSRVMKRSHCQTSRVGVNIWVLRCIFSL